MSKAAKLYDGINERMTIPAWERNGIQNRYAPKLFIPKQIYHLWGDDVLERSLQGHKVERSYTKELEAGLKEHGVPYEIRQCRSCGERMKKLVYPVVEIKEV